MGERDGLPEREAVTPAQMESMRKMLLANQQWLQSTLDQMNDESFVALQKRLQELTQSLEGSIASLFQMGTGKDIEIGKPLDINRTVQRLLAEYFCVSHLGLLYATKEHLKKDQVDEEGREITQQEELIENPDAWKGE